MRKNKSYNPDPYKRRLARIERKCDLIISLLARNSEDKELDRTINLMHHRARLLKDLAIKEAQALRTYSFSRKKNI